MTPKPTNKPVRAYSYVRFSTAAQAEGDSLRRQTALAEEYCTRHRLTLDTELNMLDLGVSAFRGKNLDGTGKLGKFLEAVGNGDVEPGSVLLVESLDRISRGEELGAAQVIQKILQAGVDVVTLRDGTRYTKGSMTGFDLIRPVVELILAREESVRKGRRVADAWSNKRAKAVADGTVMTKLVPTWMTLDAKRKPALVPERATTVREMVRMKLRGAGYMAIAAHLNRAKVPPFRRSKQWHKSVVHKILTSPALVGTFTPSIREHKDGKLLKHAQAPIAGYFPAVISEDTFARLQLTLTAPQSRGRHAKRGAASVLAGLARCPECGSIMTRIRGSNGKKYYLACTKVRAGAAKHGQRVRYDAVEELLVKEHDAILANMPSPDAEVERGLFNAQSVTNVLEERMEALLVQLERHPSDALAKRVAQLEAGVKAAQVDLADWQERAAATDSKAIKLRAGNLAASLKARPRDVARINAALRELVTHIVIDYRSGHLEFHWRSGGESSVMYGWPKVTATG